MTSEDLPVHITRREGRRRRTLDDILSAARTLLVREGTVGISLRAIAREIGMTAPALYRYFDSHEAVVTALATRLYDELVSELEAARDAVPDASVGARLITVSRQFRRWALGNRAEFGVVFANPITEITLPAHTACEAAAQRFGRVFGELFEELWLTQPFDVPETEDLPAKLRAQLDGPVEDVIEVPPEAVYVFLRCWASLYGTVTLEVFGHLRWALSDPSPIFEDMLIDNARRLGVLEDYAREGDSR